MTNNDEQNDEDHPSKSDELKWHRDVQIDLMSSQLATQLQELRTRLAEVAEQLKDGSVEDI